MATGWRSAPPRASEEEKTVQRPEANEGGREEEEMCFGGTTRTSGWLHGGNRLDSARTPCERPGLPSRCASSTHRTGSVIDRCEESSRRGSGPRKPAGAKPSDHRPRRGTEAMTRLGTLKRHTMFVLDELNLCAILVRQKLLFNTLSMTK